MTTSHSNIERGTLAVALGLLVVAPGCSSPSEDSAASLFRERAAPVLEARCTAGVCHGVPTSRIDAIEGRLPAGSLYFEVDARERLVDPQAARRKAREKINTVERPIFSSLLREPLSTDMGGVPHKGGTSFSSTRDPGFRALRDWIRAESSGGEDPEGRLNDRQKFFARKVQPRLMGRNCAATNCHGPTAFIPFRLDPGVPTDESTPEFSRATTRENYREARGFLSLSGAPEQSRLLRKALPLDEGGITHRAGNRNFFTGPEDPAARAIVEWARRERRAATGRAPPTKKPGLLYVVGPVRPRSPFEPGTFIPGRDLLFRRSLSSQETTNLTDDLHDRPADVRDPSVSPSGDSVVFAMRRGEERAFQIWEKDLPGGEARRLTSSPARLDSGRPAVNVTPVYGPAGRIYFASNRHDVRAESRARLDLDLYRMPEGGGPVERLTFTPSPELEPAIFNVAPRSGYLLFSYRRNVDRRDRTIGFSFPLDFHRDYHIFFGRTAPVDLIYEFAELPDGRSIAVAGAPENEWTGGRLAIVDRNLGPDLRSRERPGGAAVPAYRPTYRPLDPAVSPTGVSNGGIYREPAPLPDGSILVAHAPGTIDLTDRSARPDYRIERIRIEEAPDDCVAAECTPRIESRETLVDPAGDESAIDPEPVRPWVGRGPTESVLDPSRPARYSMADPAVNNGISTNLSPSGTKRFRDDVAFVRLVEALPRSPETWHPVRSSNSVGAPAMNSSAGLHMPARILGEVPLRPDGSLFVSVPPNTPFRTQYLDENRMAIGRQHNRWLYVWPGQHFSQATRPELYDQRCGGCHGAKSGRAGDVWQSPDAVTSASLTLARYEDRNPRNPKEPVELGEKTRKTVDFRGDVQPILDRHCNVDGCHAAGSSAGGVTLTDTPRGPYSVAYRNVLAEGRGSGGGYRYVDEANGRARTSHLVEIARGAELDAPKQVDDHPAVDLEPEEVRTIVRWIEVGAHYEIPQ